MKIIYFLILISYSLSLLLFPFKIRENEAEKYKSPINETKISVDTYLNHILNNYEFLSEIEVGLPRQTVEVYFKFYDNYLILLGHTTSENPFFYNISSTYREIKVNDPDLKIQVYNPHTITEIFHIKTAFYAKLKDFISSKDEISHEFTIIFSKDLPKINPRQTTKYTSSNAIEIGILVNTKYNGEHGIYKPFLNEVKENNFIENQTFFLYFFDRYKESFYYKNKKDNIYNGLVVFGKYPHELMPDKYEIKNLTWTEPFLIHSEYLDNEDIEWGFTFDQIFVEYEDNKTTNIEILRGIFDFNVEYILAPYEYYYEINKFFSPLDDICFETTNPRNINRDGAIYYMIYCDYEKLSKDILETFPKLVFKLNDFNETFEFTYKDLFKPVYDNKYYLFILFMRKMGSSGQIKEPPCWRLGRMFLHKYQFVFDAVNKKIGYYKITQTEEDIETDIDIETDEITDKITDDTTDDKTDKQEKEKETDKESDSGKKDDEEKNKDGKKESSNSIDTVYIVIFSVVPVIIIVASIIICCKCIMNKDKRKKRANELIDDAEYVEENHEEEQEQKGIN